MICRNHKDKGTCQTEIEAKKRLYLAGESSSLVGWLVNSIGHFLLRCAAELKR
jgi:hypothetical protein